MSWPGCSVAQRKPDLWDYFDLAARFPEGSAAARTQCGLADGQVPCAFG